MWQSENCRGYVEGRAWRSREWSTLPGRFGNVLNRGCCGNYQVRHSIILLTFFTWCLFSLCISFLFLSGTFHILSTSSYAIHLNNVCILEHSVTLYVFHICPHFCHHLVRASRIHACFCVLYQVSWAGVWNISDTGTYIAHTHIIMWWHSHLCVYSDPSV